MKTLLLALLLSTNVYADNILRIDDEVRISKEYEYSDEYLARSCDLGTKYTIRDANQFGEYIINVEGQKNCGIILVAKTYLTKVQK